MPPTVAEMKAVAMRLWKDVLPFSSSKLEDAFQQRLAHDVTPGSRATAVGLLCISVTLLVVELTLGTVDPQYPAMAGTVAMALRVANMVVHGVLAAASFVPAVTSNWRLRRALVLACMWTAALMALAFDPVFAPRGIHWVIMFCYPVGMLLFAFPFLHMMAFGMLNVTVAGIPVMVSDVVWPDATWPERIYMVVSTSGPYLVIMVAVLANEIQQRRNFRAEHEAQQRSQISGRLLNCLAPTAVLHQERDTLHALQEDEDGAEAIAVATARSVDTSTELELISSNNNKNGNHNSNTGSSVNMLAASTKSSAADLLASVRGGVHDAHAAVLNNRILNRTTTTATTTTSGGGGDESDPIPLFVNAHRNVSQRTLSLPTSQAVSQAASRVGTPRTALRDMFDRRVDYLQNKLKPTVYPHVTVVSVDIVGFTLLSRTITSVQLVSMLDRLFVDLDHAAAEYGMEKIKTIGDAYIVASGLFPEDGVDLTNPVIVRRHVVQACRFALAVVRIVARFSVRGKQLQCRVGVAHGDVLAGMLPVYKTVFDLFGHTTDYSATLEAKSQPGRVLCCPDTQRIVQELSDDGDVLVFETADNAAGAAFVTTQSEQEEATNTATAPPGDGESIGSTAATPHHRRRSTTVSLGSIGRRQSGTISGKTLETASSGVGSPLVRNTSAAMDAASDSVLTGTTAGVEGLVVRGPTKFDRDAVAKEAEMDEEEEEDGFDDDDGEVDDQAVTYTMETEPEPTTQNKTLKGKSNKNDKEASDATIVLGSAELQWGDEITAQYRAARIENSVALIRVVSIVMALFGPWFYPVPFILAPLDSLVVRMFFPIQVLANLGYLAGAIAPRSIIAYYTMFFAFPVMISFGTVFFAPWWAHEVFLGFGVNTVGLVLFLPDPVLGRRVAMTVGRMVFSLGLVVEFYVVAGMEGRVSDEERLVVLVMLMATALFISFVLLIKEREEDRTWRKAFYLKGKIERQTRRNLTMISRVVPLDLAEGILDQLLNDQIQLENDTENVEMDGDSTMTSLAVASRFDSTCVAFVQLRNVSEMAMDEAERLAVASQALAVVDMLAFQERVEPVKCMYGTTYLCVRGATKRYTPEENTAAMRTFALRAMDALEEWQHSQQHVHPEVSKLAFAIGINEGPLVAGVIGASKFLFDIWGATVNLAQRMMSAAPAGAIEIPLRMAKLMHQTSNGSVVDWFSQPALRQIKGAGMIETVNIKRNVQQKEKLDHGHVDVPGYIHQA